MVFAIVGYGRLGRAAELLLRGRRGIELFGVFSRRDNVITDYAKVLPLDKISTYKNDIDCLLICLGSSADAPIVTPMLAESFNTVDTYDNHRAIRDYLLNVGNASSKTGHTSVVSMGWDPGIMSVMRLYASSFISNSRVSSFWGEGVSRGHTEAIKRIEGVKDAVQYTVPKNSALNLAIRGIDTGNDKDRHRRVCYVVCDDKERERVEREIRNIEDYFKGYDTEVHFISEEEFNIKHKGERHKGRVIAYGVSGAYNENVSLLDFNIEMDSNSQFTASILISGAIACVKLNREGKYGAYSPIDIPPKYFGNDGLYYDFL